MPPIDLNKLLHAHKTAVAWVAVARRRNTDQWVTFLKDDGTVQTVTGPEAIQEQVDTTLIPFRQDLRTLFTFVLAVPIAKMEEFREQSGVPEIALAKDRLELPLNDRVTYHCYPVKDSFIGFINELGVLIELS